MDSTAGTTVERFDAFLERAEPRLRRALVATYGPVIGRDAAVDALSWAWEHWDRLRSMANPVGYLYRVGQTAAARHQSPVRRGPADAASATPGRDASDVHEPGLEPALARLSEQQRAAAVLVHGYAMSQREAADVLGISVSTLREHLARGMDRLRAELGDEGADHGR